MADAGFSAAKARMDSLPAPQHSLPSITDPFKVCPRVAYIRIQKTGSSTLGEIIIPMMCMKHNQTAYSFEHIEYNGAKRKAGDCTLTMLRDPVERFVSEFTFVRSFEEKLVNCTESDQWDFDAEDLPFLRQVKTQADNGAAFLAYLLHPRNPARNRQTLYVLGFQRVPCRADRCCGGAEQCSKWPDRAGFPAGEYDWDGDHDELLARAKGRLLGMRAFGVADCFVESMQVIADGFGWDAKAMQDMARAIHLRQQKGAEASGLEAAQTHTSADGPSSWQSFLTDDLVKEIRRINRLDDELVAFAKQRLYERHGIRCGGSVPAAQQRSTAEPRGLAALLKKLAASR